MVHDGTFFDSSEPAQVEIGREAYGCLHSGEAAPSVRQASSIPGIPRC
jgi:hypothetical protein